MVNYNGRVILTFTKLNLFWFYDQVREVSFLVMTGDLRFACRHSSVMVLKVDLSPLASEQLVCCDIFCLVL